MRITPGLTSVFSRALLAIIVLSVLSLLAILASLVTGSVDISFRELFEILCGRNSGMHSQVIMELRLPRTISGFLVGAMLALAGVLMQVLLKNPLAEPYVLGVSGGASVFALLAMVAGLAGWYINASAFAGAFFSMMMVFGLSRYGGHWNALRVLLTGIVVASGWGALISFLLAVSPASQLHGMLFWLMGDLEYATTYKLSAFLLSGGFICAMLMARDLNLLGHGDKQAAALGVRVKILRYAIYFLASILTAGAVTQAGSIGFVGLIVPHLVRLILGSDHRVLIPVSVVLGGTLLVVADTMARVLIAPQQLPVGVLTAMIGVPLFLVLLQTTVIRSRS